MKHQIKTKNIQEFKNKPLPIVEIFGNTLQGEGPRLKPAIFLRTGLCNFVCAGFQCERTAPNGEITIGCDTQQSVHAKLYKDTWDYYENFNDVVQRIKPLIHPNPDIKQDLIFSGGEPLLHWNNKTYQELLEYYITRNHHITIESNGSKMIDFTKEYQRNIQFSLSVKLSNSLEPKKKRINIPALANIFDNCPDSYLKFVVSPETWEESKKEIFEILTALPHHVEVYLMGMGETRQKQVEVTRFVFEKCAELGFNYSPRMHIIAFDDLDGV